MRTGEPTGPAQQRADAELPPLGILIVFSAFSPSGNRAGITDHFPPLGNERPAKASPRGAAGTSTMVSTVGLQGAPCRSVVIGRLSAVRPNASAGEGPQASVGLMLPLSSLAGGGTPSHNGLRDARGVRVFGRRRGVVAAPRTRRVRGLEVWVVPRSVFARVWASCQHLAIPVSAVDLDLGLRRS